MRYYRRKCKEGAKGRIVINKNVDNFQLPLGFQIFHPGYLSLTAMRMGVKISSSCTRIIVESMCHPRPGRVVEVGQKARPALQARQRFRR